MPKRKNISLDNDARKNLQRYVELVWEIFKQAEEKKEQQRRSSLKDEWSKRSKDH